MKKLIATILSIFYLATSFGATVHFHYCMDELVYWGLENQQEDKCSNCGMENAESQDGCCTNDQQQLKVEGDQKVATSAFSLVPPTSFAAIVRFFEYKPTVSVMETTRPHLDKSPPGKPGLAVYLRNCVFLI